MVTSKDDKLIVIYVMAVFSIVKGANLLNDFIQQTVEFLKYSDIGIDNPSIESMTFNSDGTRELTLSSFGFTGAAEIKENVLLSVTILFSLLDVLVDKEFPELEGKSLRKRYLDLPSLNDYQIIFKEVYRIMKVFRNAIVHSKSSVSANNDSFSIDYDYKGSHFRLAITSRALRMIFSMIVHFARLREAPYITGIFRNYYDEILNGIVAFSDDVNSPLAATSGGLRLKRLRYRTKDRPHQIDEGANSLSISRYELPAPDNSWASLDYYVLVNGHLYLVPDEALNSSGAIAKIDLENWIYDKDRFFH